MVLLIIFGTIFITCRYIGTSGLFVKEYSLDYDSSKAGLINLTHNLANHFAPYVRVNCICPGWVNTPMNCELSDEFINSEKDKILIKQRLEYSASKTPQELLKELDESRNRRRLIDKSGGLGKDYEILTNVNNRKYTIGGQEIKRFSEKNDTVEFLRTIDDMRVSNFPTGDVEDYIFEVR